MDKEKVKLAVDQVFRDMAGAMTAGMAFVGTRTGLFRAMQGKGPMSVDEVVRAAGLQPRYVEEWLKGMAAAGYLEYQRGKYLLSDEHAYFLASEGSDHFVGGMWEMLPALMRTAPQVAEAFAKGGGVRFEDFGPACVEALDLLNLPAPPTAIFATTDTIAMGVLLALEERSVPVPEEMAVVGYDNTYLTVICRPRLTSVAQPKQQMGRWAATFLIDWIEQGRADGDEPVEVVLDPQLVVRESTMPGVRALQGRDLPLSGVGRSGS